MTKKSKKKKSSGNGRYTPPKDRQNSGSNPVATAPRPSGNAGIRVFPGSSGSFSRVRIIDTDVGIHVAGGEIILDEVDIVDSNTGIVQTGGVVDANEVTIRKSKKPRSG